MKFAFCLFKFFPFGGLQQNFLMVVEECLRRNHQVDCYYLRWEGPPPPLGLNCIPVPTKRHSRHGRYAEFGDFIASHIRPQKYDLIVGFNKLPHIDLYYGADPCYAAKASERRSFWYRLTPRYQTLAQMEKKVFESSSKSKIFLLAEVEMPDFQKYYHTQTERFYFLPPGISRACCFQPGDETIRQRVRSAAGLTDVHKLILLVGSGFRTKGVDRALTAVASIPTKLRQNTRFWVIGQDNPKPFQRLASRLGISNIVTFFPGRSDIPDLLKSADLLLHPAYRESAGSIILEALVAGLPVLVTDICGFAPHVSKAQAGIVLPRPFVQHQLNQALVEMLTSPEHQQWHKNAIQYGRTEDLYSRTPITVDQIERFSRGEN